MTPPEIYNGSKDDTLPVTDGELSDSTTFTLTVNPVNDAPTLDDLADASIAEDSSYTLELSGADIDGDALTFLASVDANGSVDVDGSTLTVTPAANYNGDITVNVIASDGQGSGSGSFTLSVMPVNDAPVIGALDNQTIDEDTSLTIELSATDIDSNDLTFSATNGDSDIVVDGSTLTITPPANYNGSEDVTVTVSDGELSDSTTFTLTVNAVNDAPTLDDLADASIPEDSSYTLELSGTDIDGDALTFLASVDANGSASVSGSTLTVTPDSDYNGFLLVSVIASDGQASGSGSLTLTVTAVNDAPVIGTLDNQVIDEDTSLTVDLSASDIDGDALTFSATNGDSDIVVDGTTLTITPPANYNGNEDVTVTVTDGDLSDSTTFTLTINPVNDAPTLDDLANASVAEDTDFVLELSGADIDGDALTFLASVDANGSVEVNGSTLTVSPAADYNGDITVSVIASDGQASGSGSFTLTVTAVNDAPVIGTLDNQVIDEDTSLTVELSASDIDGDALTFSATNGDSDIVVDGTTLTITPPANYNGERMLR